MRITFLFWNLQRGKGKRLGEALGRLGRQNIDVFAFAECPAVEEVEARLNSEKDSKRFGVVPSEAGRVRFFSSLDDVAWFEPFSDYVSNRFTALELRLPNVDSLLLIGAHLDSPDTMSLAGRAEWARRLAVDVRRIESDLGQERTILVGDLNMNPFDGGLVDASALHSVMTRQLTLAVKGHSSRDGYPPFYNPMWSCYGERATRDSVPAHGLGPAGTYFFSNTRDPANTFWNMYDQVLLRPSIMHNLVHLEIVDSDGESSLLTREGRPRSNLYSDHLPVLFEVDF